MAGRMRLALAGALLAASVLAAPASAAVWAIVPGESQVLFDYERNGKPATGRFDRFSGEGTFDPEAPEAATLEVRIESASIDVDDKVVSNFATTAEYFDSDNYPLVTYRLLRLTPEGGNRYLAEGELAIRQWTRETRTSVNLDIGEDTAHATGTLRVLRKDYHFGVGPASLFVDLGPEVAVRFDLTARPVP
jgi:polyisoprenoid-binding protein YceI